MNGYGPAAEAIRAERGLPYATGADDPPAWHDIIGATGPDDCTATEFTGASGAGLPGTSMQPSEQAETDLLYEGTQP